jgi:C-terminal processing protease CtpA/Prc
VSRAVPAMAMLLLVATGLPGAHAASPSPPPKPAAEPSPPASPEEPGWLGFFLGDAPDGGARVVAVVNGGPAAKAGIREGDLLLLVDEKPVTDRRRLREAMGGLQPGQKVALALLREGKVELREIQAEPRVIRLRVPRIPAEQWFVQAYGAADGAGGAALASIPDELRAFYGAPGDTGVLVTAVEPESAAAAAGVKVGDVLVRADGKAVREPGDLAGRLAFAKPGASVVLDLVRGGKPLTVSLRGPGHDFDARSRAARITEIEEEMEGLKARIEELQREVERLRKAR